MSDCLNCLNYESIKCENCYIWDYEKGFYSNFDKKPIKKDIVQSVCCECGKNTLCNQKTELCLDCDKSFNETKLNNYYKIEQLLNELKEYTEEKERLMLIAFKHRDEYQDKINMYQDQMINKSDIIKSKLLGIIDIDSMKETKTQKIYESVSGQIIIEKLDHGTLKLKLY